MPSCHSHTQSQFHQLTIFCCGHGPANHLTREEIQGTELAVFPGVIAALGNVQGIAEQPNGILVTLLVDELKF
jgi:hypothetical protein